MNEQAKETEAPTRIRILQEGARLTSGNRDVSYGPPIHNLTLAGELKQVLRARMRRNMSPGELEALDQVLTKIARCATGGYNRDNYVDGATYFAIAGEIGEVYDIQDRRVEAERAQEAARQAALTGGVAEALDPQQEAIPAFLGAAKAG